MTTIESAARPNQPGPLGDIPRELATETTKGLVLAVDDDRAFLHAYRRILQAAGYQVVVAHDGLAAQTMVEAIHFDIILSDILMPGMTGLELLKAVRSKDLDVPVVLIAGSGSDEVADAAVELGALMFLVKPVADHTLLNVVAQGVNLHKLAKAKRAAALHLGATGKLLGDRAGLEVAFGRALASIWVAYQPLVHWKERRIFGFEALLRSGEPLFPNPPALVEAAERLDRVHDLGRTIRNRIAATGCPDDALLFVNLHPTDLNDDALYDPSQPLSRLAPRVVLEITERATLDDVDDVPSRIAALRKLGFRIAIDDLGAGYAGLTAFAELGPEVAKIDMSLLRGIDADPIRRKIVGTIAGLCRDMSVTVVAEGVETAGERDVAAELGCEIQQGYLFARPARPFPDVSFR